VQDSSAVDVDHSFGDFEEEAEDRGQAKIVVAEVRPHVTVGSQRRDKH